MIPRPPQPAPSATYFPLLDGLRAFAVTGVLLSHFSPTASRLVDTGSAGVHLFFVLSGFLITGLLLDARGRIDDRRTTLGSEWRTFLIRRTLRIFPLYYGVLVLGWAFNIEHVRSNTAWLVTYGYNFRIWTAGGWPDRLLAHFWSLAVEEQFYLIWPWLILCAPRRLLPWAMLALLPLAFGFRVLCNLGFLGPQIGQVVLLPSCWDLLAAGGLTAWASRTGFSSSSKGRTILTLASGVGLAGLIWNLSIGPEAMQHTRLWPIEYSCDALLFASLVHICTSEPGRWLRLVLAFPVIIYLGRISYGIYVFHDFMHYLGPGISQRLFGVRYFHREWEHVMWLCFCSVAAAVISYHFYERPWQGLKRRWAPSVHAADPP